MSDGYVIRGRVWPGDEQARRCVIYFHGIQSHGGWYEWSASLLAEAGCAVVLPDRRGSGLNGPPRGDVASIARWREDVDAIVEWSRGQFGAARVAILGMSWGGKLAADLAQRRPEVVERVLLLTPGIFPAVDVGFGGRLRIAASLVAGGKAEHLIPLSDPALFTDSAAGRAFIEADPLKLTHATARFLWHSSRLDSALRRLAPRSLAPAVSLMLAASDRIIRNEATIAWLENVCARRDAVNVLPGAHTLEFADDPTAFRAMLQTWAR